jgi:hypothetical protein
VITLALALPARFIVRSQSKIGAANAR